MKFDPGKRRENIAKHGIDLAIAVGFEFDTAIVDEDRDSTSEQRFRAIGWIGSGLFFFVYAMRGDDVRAISLRLVTKQERRRYEQDL